MDFIISSVAAVTMFISGLFSLAVPVEAPLGGPRVLIESQGGTGTSTYAVGDILYSSTTDQLTTLPIGTNGQGLVVSGGIPIWGQISASDPNWTYFGSPQYNPFLSTTDTNVGILVNASSTFAGTTNFTGTSTFNNVALIKGKINQPVPLGVVKQDDYPGYKLSGPTQMVTQGDFAYLVDGTADSFSIFSIVSPDRPVLVTSTADGQGVSNNLNGAWAISVAGNYAYIASALDNALVVIDISNPTLPKEVGVLHQGASYGVSQATAVVVSGKYAYVSGYNQSGFRSGLTVVDISNPKQPRAVSFVQTKDDFFNYGAEACLAISGQFIYHCTSVGFQVYDVSDPYNPVRVTNVSADPHLEGGIVIYGTTLYYGDDNGITSFDISNPRDPIQGQAYNVNISDSRELVLTGHYLYVTSHDTDSVVILDVASSTNIMELAVITSSTNAYLDGVSAIAVQGNYMYTAAGANSRAFQTFDVGGADISNLQAGNIKTGYLNVLADGLFDRSVNVRGGLTVGNGGLLVAGGISMQTLASSTVDNMVATNTIRSGVRMEFTASSTLGNVYTFDTPSNTVPNGLVFMSIKNNGAPVASFPSAGLVGCSSLQTDSTGLFICGGGGSDINWTMSNGNLTPTSTSRGIDIFSTSTFSALTNIEGKVVNPIPLGYVQLDEVLAPIFVAPIKMAFDGKTAYVTDISEKSLVMIDTTYPDTPVYYNKIVDGGPVTSDLDAPYDIALSGGFGYIVNKVASGTLAVFDLSNPTRPKQVGVLRENAVVGLSGAGALAISGNYAFISAQRVVTSTISARGVMTVVDIADPKNPRFVTSTDLRTPSGSGFFSSYSCVTISGDYAYVCDSDGFTVFNISDPNNPRLSNHYTTDAHSDGTIAIYGNQMYYAKVDGIQRFDITNPDAVSPGNTITNVNMSNVRRMFIGGRYLYAPMASTLQVQVLDLKNPGFEELVGTVSYDAGRAFLDAPVAAHVEGGYMYIINQGTDPSFQTYDVSGADISNARIGVLESGPLHVHATANFDRSVFIREGLAVGPQGLTVGGDLSLFHSSSTDRFATNTIRFDNKAFFFASSSFTFAASTTATTPLLLLQNKGANVFQVSTAGLISCASVQTDANGLASCGSAGGGSDTNWSYFGGPLPYVSPTQTDVGLVVKASSTFTGNLSVFKNLNVSSTIVTNNVSSTGALLIGAPSNQSILFYNASNVRFDTSMEVNFGGVSAASRTSCAFESSWTPDLFGCFTDTTSNTFLIAETNDEGRTYTLQTETQPTLKILTEDADAGATAFNKFIAMQAGDNSSTIFTGASLLQLSPASNTVQIANRFPGMTWLVVTTTQADAGGAINMKDSDGVGCTIVTFNDGVMTAVDGDPLGYCNSSTSTGP